MSARHVSWIMEFATAIVIGVVLVLIASGCTSQRDWQRVWSTLEVGASTGVDGDGSISKGDRSYDMEESTRLFASIHPLAFIDPPREVVVVSCERPK